ncbi:acyltransferase family protein [Frigoribacterium faeni]|uniref:Fucose 4-O-acetylase-like acetyltransferase n=1 Tax=Frigoribacterium faeni TaxID=145483 RepID=A0A7W3JK29_9MICO|nr:acyltransferase family protein [Frigoribacterium faeni]MBA8814174.1 fucose 4-O-acetylase-like acetyltransferase [Frigoribacterium faeni]
MATVKKARNAGIDFVRVLGIVAVVVGHSWNIEAVGRWVYPWHVPIFFFLTGYLLKNDRSFSVEFRSRVRSLAYPYVFWLVVFGLAYGLGLANAARLGPDSIEMVIWGGSAAYRPFTTFWFFSVLFFTALLARVIWRFPKMIRWICAGAGIVLGLVFGPELAGTPLSIASALPCLFFVVAGAELRSIRKRLRRPGLYGSALLVLSVACIASNVAPAMNIKGGSYGSPLSVLIALSMCVGLLLVSESLFAKASTATSLAVTSLAVPGLIVVLLHPAVLWALGVPDEARIWQFALVLLVPWLAGLIAVRAGLPQFVTGVAPVRRWRALRLSRSRD